MEPSAAPGPSGRRDNGLPSAAWGALVDLDPRLSETLLARLAAAGVPAFVEPAAGHTALTRAVQLPDRPLDRLWVDPVRAEAARAVVAAEVADLTALLAEREPGATAHGFVQPVPRSAAARVLEPPALPDPPARRRPVDPASAVRATDPPPPAPSRPDDSDEAWRQIVAGFSAEPASPVPPWPAAEDVEQPPRTRTWTGRPERSGEVPRRRRTDPPSDAPPSGSALPGWVEPDAVEDDGHYVPPPPPPVPRLAPRKLAAALTLLAGLLLMFAPGLLLQPRTPGVGVFGALLTVGGAAALVWLMRDAPPTDSGPDDGAVV